jgi:hypothetical protein
MDWLSATDDGHIWIDGSDGTDGILPLVVGRAYQYRLRMRDTSAKQNESDDTLSQEITAEFTPSDGDDEAPEPPVWADVIYRYNCLQVNIDLEECFEIGIWDVLEVVPAEDPQGADVEYWFEQERNGDIVSSGWIAEEVWQVEAGGLFTFNSYRVKVRDTSQSYNESDWGIGVSKSTY